MASIFCNPAEWFLACLCNNANTNCSIAQSLERLGQVCDAALAAKLRVRGYISCVLGCPYEGEVDPNRVADVAPLY